MTPAFKFLAFLEKRNNDESHLNGRFITVSEDVANDYYKDILPVIPAGTTMRIDFAGDFGLYAYADISGKIHKVRIDLRDLSKLDWSPYQSEIDATLA